MARPVNTLLGTLQFASELVEKVHAEGSALNDRDRRRLMSEASQLARAVGAVSESLDPIATPAATFDPADPTVVGRMVALALLGQARQGLKDLPRAYGSGVYAIYYNGGFSAYADACGTDTPLYVGKANPSTPTATTPKLQGDRLWARLREHSKSINSAENLALDDFECRFLVVASSWQASAETFLIDFFKPVWNSETKICYGIGKHGDSAKTRTNTRSPWDTLHPGRRWAWKEGNVPNPNTAAMIADSIVDHYKCHPPLPEGRLDWTKFIGVQ